MTNIPGNTGGQPINLSAPIGLSPPAGEVGSDPLALNFKSTDRKAALDLDKTYQSDSISSTKAGNTGQTVLQDVLADSPVLDSPKTMTHEEATVVNTFINNSVAANTPTAANAPAANASVAANAPKTANAPAATNPFLAANAIVNFKAVMLSLLRNQQEQSLSQEQIGLTSMQVDIDSIKQQASEEYQGKMAEKMGNWASFGAGLAGATISAGGLGLTIGAKGTVEKEVQQTIGERSASVNKTKSLQKEIGDLDTGAKDAQSALDRFNQNNPDLDATAGLNPADGDSLSTLQDRLYSKIDEGEDGPVSALKADLDSLRGQKNGLEVQIAANNQDYQDLEDKQTAGDELTEDESGRLEQHQADLTRLSAIDGEIAGKEGEITGKLNEFVAENPGDVDAAAYNRLQKGQEKTELTQKLETAKTKFNTKLVETVESMKSTYQGQLADAQKALDDFDKTSEGKQLKKMEDQLKVLTNKEASGAELTDEETTTKSTLEEQMKDVKATRDQKQGRVDDINKKLEDLEAAKDKMGTDPKEALTEVKKGLDEQLVDAQQKLKEAKSSFNEEFRSRQSKIDSGTKILEGMVQAFEKGVQAHVTGLSAVWQQRATLERATQTSAQQSMSSSGFDAYRSTMQQIGQLIDTLTQTMHTLSEATRYRG